MNRQNLLLSILGGILVVVGFWFFLWKPQGEELARIEGEISTAETQIATLEGRIVALEDVRARAPEIEAALVAAESIVPRDAALPSALRQVQLAADDSGVELIAVTPGRPTQVSEELGGLAQFVITMQIEGGYYQIVDFLRRIEDPAISPRGLLWDAMDLSVGEDYPTLSGSLAGRMFAVLPAPPVEETPTPAPSEQPSPGSTPTPTETSTEVTP